MLSRHTLVHMTSHQPVIALHTGRASLLSLAPVVEMVKMNSIRRDVSTGKESSGTESTHPERNLSAWTKAGQ